MNNNLAPITLQDDETFVENIQNKNTVYKLYFYYGIVCIVVSSIIMYVCKTYLKNDAKLENLTNIAFYGAILVCLVGIFATIYCGLLLKKTQGTNYFLTSKRLYVKLSKNEEYQAFSKDDIHLVSHRNKSLNFGLLLELKNGEILHLLSINDAEKVRTQIEDIMYK